MVRCFCASHSAAVPRGQRVAALLVPLLFSFVLIRASAALSLYWLASNLVSLGQHYLLERRLRTA